MQPFLLVHIQYFTRYEPLKMLMCLYTCLSDHDINYHLRNISRMSIAKMKKKHEIQTKSQTIF